MGSRWVSYRIPDVTCNPFSSQRLRERINNDTINLAHFPSRSVPFRCRFVGFAPAGGNREKGGEKGEHEAIKKWGSPQEGLLRPRPHIYHLSAGPSEASGEISEVSVPNSLVHCPARIFSLSLSPPLSLSSPSNQADELSWKISLFLFSHGFAGGDKSARALFQHATDRNWTFGEPSETCHPIHFVFRRIWE